jgi:hypothetical protein
MIRSRLLLFSAESTTRFASGNGHVLGGLFIDAAAVELSVLGANTMRWNTIAAVGALVVLGAAAGYSSDSRSTLTASEARAIAKDAYVYGFPMVDSYRIQHAYFIDRQNPEFKAPWNELRNIPRVFTPEDKAVQTPNSDTPYSMAGLDLRAEALVLTVPAIEKGRYFSVQLIDLYTHNFDYIGSRATGNDTAAS